MKENQFSKNMNSKSNTELENIIENKHKYTADAIQAVIWELEKRDAISENDIEINQKIIDKEKESLAVELKEYNNEESAFDEFENPTLYSKRAIQGFSIFFSTFFGTVLLMSNLKAMNKSKARIQVLVFGILYTVFIYTILNYLPKTYFTTLILNLIGSAILTEFFWNKELGNDLKFTKKQITKPLIISLLITAFFIFLIFLPVILGEQNV